MAREGRERSRDRDDRDSEFTDRLVHINRVAKVVKGGKRFGFAALVVDALESGAATLKNTTPTITCCLICSSMVHCVENGLVGESVQNRRGGDGPVTV